MSRYIRDHKASGGRYDRKVTPALHQSTCDVCHGDITLGQMIIRQRTDQIWIHATCAPGGDDE